MALTSRRSWTAVLPPLAIVIPAGLLAVLGARAYRAEALLLRDGFVQDQAAIVRLVASRLVEEARKALDDLAARVRDRDPDQRLAVSFAAAHPIARHVFVVRGGRVVYPSGTPMLAAGEGLPERTDELRFDTDVRRYIIRLRERRRVRALVDRGLRAEYAERLEDAERDYRRAATMGTQRPAAGALLGLARLRRRREDKDGAAAAYRQLRRRFGQRRDDEGVSYALLADVGLAAATDDSALFLRLHRDLLAGEYATSASSRRFYLRWALDHLQRGAPIAAAAGAADASAPAIDGELLARIKRRTATVFAADRFGQLLRRHGIAERPVSADGPTAFAIDPRTILAIRRRGQTVVGFSIDEEELARRVREQSSKLPSARRGIRLALARAGQGHRPGPDVVHSTMLEAPLSHWTLTALRPGGDPLAAFERREQLRHLAMVLGLVAVLAAGLLFTFRAVRRESDLAQLKSDFASNVSHELKTPLTSIRMYAEMLQQDIARSQEDRDRYQGVIVREAERLGRLIANVLDFSRVERGTRRYDLLPLEIEQLAREAVDTFRRLSEGESITITFADPDHPARRVVADREAAVQSVLNLLSNAAKYSRGAPEIGVCLLPGDGEHGIEVSDRGIGIAPPEQKHIFDDFYRAPQARQQGVEGTGLGLALVKRHMVACGGRVDVSSEVGQGSRFTLWFKEPASQGS